MDCSNVINMGTNGSGVMNLFVGAGSVTGSPDFGVLSSLFDICRVTGYTVAYEPVGAGQVQTTSTCCLHVPMIVVGDPDAVVNIAYATLVQQRLLTEKGVLFCNTGRKFRQTHLFPSEKKAISTASGAVQSCFGVWGDTNAVSVQHGGLLISSQTNATNASNAYGYAMITWHVEWSNRL